MHPTHNDDVWIAGITIGFDAVAFGVVFPDEPQKITAFTTALLDLPDAKEVEGPFYNGVMVVTFEDTDAAPDELRLRVYTVIRQYAKR